MPRRFLKRAKMKKAIIFDAGTIINFSMNSLLDLLGDLKKIFEGNFLITEDIEYEVVTRPIKVKRFELSALRVKQLIKDNVLELPYAYGIRKQEVEKRTQEFMDIANKTFIARGKYLHLIDLGEASCLALSEILSRKGVKNVIAIDERTTRMLCENPENIRKLLESKLHTKIKAKQQNFFEFEKFKMIRSTELAYIAYKNNLVNFGNGNLLDALLYAVKYKGCSISIDEIEQLKRM
jgi:hypothetical protein